MEIANGVDTPLLIDEATKKRAFGHYVDLSKYIFAEMMVEREGYVFHVDVVSEKLPDLCSHCLTIGKIEVVPQAHTLPSPSQVDTHESVLYEDKTSLKVQTQTQCLNHQALC
ncbi:hypothetical protein MTR_6g043980 [Medicago truncatula]|uniref:Uncharacterized protein n=1 Tax=Medicago truncatula TaxID=3880 RepID=A0A072U9I9_MEDTR|nr:hypothetical protein MTR_6g043980 [Medicago truncatula]